MASRQTGKTSELCETEPKRHVGDACRLRVGAQQQPIDLLEAPLTHEAHGGHAATPFESANQGFDADTGDLGEIGKRNRFAEMGHDIFLDTPQRRVGGVVTYAFVRGLGGNKKRADKRTFRFLAGNG